MRAARVESGAKGKFRKITTSARIVGHAKFTSFPGRENRVVGGVIFEGEIAGWIFL